ADVHASFDAPNTGVALLANHAQIHHRIVKCTMNEHLDIVYLHAATTRHRLDTAHQVGTKRSQEILESRDRAVLGVERYRRADGKRMLAHMYRRAQWLRSRYAQGPASVFHVGLGSVDVLAARVRLTGPQLRRRSSQAHSS